MPKRTWKRIYWDYRNCLVLGIQFLKLKMKRANGAAIQKKYFEYVAYKGIKIGHFKGAIKNRVLY